MSDGLMMLAILPGVLIIIYVYRKDKVEKEPWRLIFKLMLFGALSCIPASFMESMIDGAMPHYPEGTLPYALSMAFVSAALCEEICKYALLKIGTWRSPEFGYRFDGIVYGVAVAVGFAILENILYVSQYGFYTGIVRAVMAVPLHAFCGVFMGIFYGAAKQAQVRGQSNFQLRILALVVPMLIHGIYDTLAFLGNSTASIVLLAFVVLMYIVSIRVIRQFSQDDWQSGFYPESEPLSRDGGYGGFGGQGGSSGFGNQAGFGGGFSGQGGSGGFGNQTGFGGQGGQGGYGGGQRYRSAGAGYRAHPGEVQNGKLILLCPHCRRGLRVPVGMGQIRVRCPHCGKEFSERT